MITKVQIEETLERKYDNLNGSRALKLVYKDFMNSRLTF